MNLFAQSAIESAIAYQNWLIKNGQGNIEYTVSKIEQDGDKFLLNINAAPHSLDDLQVKINNREYTQEEIMPVSYDEKHHRLTVRPQPCFCKDLLEADPKNVLLISSMRFLVKRVQKWYEQHGDKICLPTRNTIPEYNCKSLKKSPSDDQSAAIRGALAQPFTYIWGAPGTGKTRFVLARCVLACIKNKSRILITAPTNNAVEQTLRGVLEVMKEAEIDYKGVVARVGVASSEFAAEYPEVCENPALVKKLAALDLQIAALNKELKHLKRYRYFRNHFQKYQKSVGEVQSRFDDFLFFQEQITRFEKDCQVLSGRITVGTQEIKQVEQAMEHCVSQIASYNAQIDHYSSSFFRFLFAKKLETTKALLADTLHTFDLEKARRQETLANLAGWKDKLARNRTQIEQCTQKRAALRKEAVHLSASWLLPAEEEPMHKKIDAAFADSSSDILKTAIDQYDAFMEQKRQEYIDCVPYENSYDARIEELNSQLQEALAQKDSINKMNRTIDAATCIVVGATIDTCIGRIAPTKDNQFAHIFLDEAGYCSLIKGVTLTAFHCPITLLGDHMQLPPVCEANEDAMRDEPTLTYWAISALYAEYVFTWDHTRLPLLHKEQVPLPSGEMRQYDLLHSFRFGTALAEILAGRIYSPKFRGDDSCNTEILVIDAAQIPVDLKIAKKNRQDPAECACIVRYCKAHPDENIGIITPYKNQRDLIRKEMLQHGLHMDDILTVHGSQGREWDTVLFSVADSTSNMFFTNTENPSTGGLYLVNTAVSRARKKLIIVCDREPWSTKKQQLIGQLLRVAREEPLPLNPPN